MSKAKALKQDINRYYLQLRKAELDSCIEELRLVVDAMTYQSEHGLWQASLYFREQELQTKLAALTLEIKALEEEGLILNEKQVVDEIFALEQHRADLRLKAQWVSEYLDMNPDLPNNGRAYKNDLRIIREQIEYITAELGYD